MSSNEVISKQIAQIIQEIVRHYREWNSAGQWELRVVSLHRKLQVRYPILGIDSRGSPAALFANGVGVPLRLAYLPLPTFRTKQRPVSRTSGQGMQHDR